MPNYEFTSPVYLILLGLYFFTSSIKTFDIRLTQAKQGFMGEELANVANTEPPLPTWIGAIFILDWVLATVLFILNWKVTIIVWIIRFILKVLPVLETIGNVILSPFRSKLSPSVSSKHLKIARTIITLNQTSVDNKVEWDHQYQKVKSELVNIDGSKEDKEAIIEAISFLGGKTEFTNEDVADWCENRQREIERSSI